MKYLFILCFTFSMLGCGHNLCDKGPSVSVSFDSADYCFFQANERIRCGFSVPELVTLGKEACLKVWPEERVCYTFSWKAEVNDYLIRTEGTYYSSVILQGQL